MDMIVLELQTWWNNLIAQAQASKKSIFVNSLLVQNFSATDSTLIDLGNGYWGIIATFLIGNTRDGSGVNIASVSGGLSPDAEAVEITLRKTEYTADEYGDNGGFTDEILRDADGNAFGEVYSDLLQWQGSTLISYDYDGLGYANADLPLSIYRVPYADLTTSMRELLKVDGLNEYSGSSGWFTSASSFNVEKTTSDPENAINGDYSDYATYQLSSNDSASNSNELALVLGVDLAPIKTDKRVFVSVSAEVYHMAIDGALPSPKKWYNRSSAICVGKRSSTVGDPNISGVVVIGDDHDGSGTPQDIPTTFDIVDNYFPLLENAPTAEKPFRYQANGGGVESGFSGFSIEITNLLDELYVAGGATLYLSLFVNIEGVSDKISTIDFRIKNISMAEEVEIVGDNVYTNWDGREVGGAPITNTSEAYDLACRLQNLRDTDIDVPVAGWGQEEPTEAQGLPIDWSNYINLATSYGGVYSIQRNVQADIQDATKLKKDLTLCMVALGAVDDNGIEGLYSLVDGLNNTDGLLIEYGELLPKTEPIKKRIDQSEDLWEMGNVLYTAYGIKKRFKQDVLTSGTATRDFISDMMQWFGLVDELPSDPLNNNWVAKERFTLQLELPLSYIFTNSIFIGQKIRFNHVFDGLCSGIIYQRSYDLVNAAIKIYVHCIGPDTIGGGDRDVYIETGTADLDIIETGSQEDSIEEGK
jgi:hypothetical protein